MQFDIEFPDFKENNSEEKIINLINKIDDVLIKVRGKIFSHQEKKLKEYIGLLIKIKNRDNTDLHLEDVNDEILNVIKEVEGEYEKQIKLDELYKDADGRNDDHLDPYRFK